MSASCEIYLKPPIVIDVALESSTQVAMRPTIHPKFHAYGTRYIDQYLPTYVYPSTYCSWKQIKMRRVKRLVFYRIAIYS